MQVFKTSGFTAVIVGFVTLVQHPVRVDLIQTREYP